MKNGGVGDGGQGKGKGKSKLLTHTTEDKHGGVFSICYKWNQGKPCAETPCTHKHVCRICQGDHPMSQCNKK